MIHIGTPYKEVENGISYLKAPVEISEDTVSRYIEITSSIVNCNFLTDYDYPPEKWTRDNTMWFSFPAEYADHLCIERSNAFVVALFWYAMVTGSDISFDAPISEKLHNGITDHLMVEMEKSGFKPVRLIGSLTAEPVASEKGVGTGMSVGVDSTYTAHCYYNDDTPSDVKLTHLTEYSGSYRLPKLEPPYDVDKVFEEYEQKYSSISSAAKKYSEYIGLPLIISSTNMDKDFYRGGLIFTAMYRFAAHSLALEHLFSAYISSSSGHVDHNTEVSLMTATQNYEDLICECIQTEGFNYFTSDHEPRTEKLRAIADDTAFQKYADVCYNPSEEGINCGVCYGCWKTMIPLDILGKLDKFDRSFKLDNYYDKRKEVFADLIEFSKRPEAFSARKTVEQILTLAHKENNDVGNEFIEVYNEHINR